MSRRHILAHPAIFIGIPWAVAAVFYAVWSFGRPFPESSQIVEELATNYEYAQAWMSFATTLISLATLVAAIIAALYAKRAIDIDLRPHLSAQVNDLTNFDYGTAVSDVSEDPSKEVWFTINNAGRSAAIVTTIYRAWSLCPKGTYPAPVRIEGSSYESYAIKRENNIPIGSGANSILIRANRHWIPKIGRTIPEHDSDLFFQLVIGYEDISSSKYECGILFQLFGDRFIVAWPQIDFEKFNYNKKI